MSDWLLVIDGGATKTACAIVHSETGSIPFTKTGGGSNYQAIGVEKTKEALQEILTEVQTFLEKQETQKIAAATFAMSGIDSAKDYATVESIIYELVKYHHFDIQALIIENDAEATLLGATKGQSGALLIAGTGAIAFAYDGKTLVRAGGWGHRAGDEGSGYWLGQEVIRAIFKMEDGRGEPTILKKAVYQYLRIEDASELAAWLFRPSYTNAQLAKMGSFLADAVAKNDNCAIQISTRAAHELVLLACAVLKNNQYNGERFTLYCNGGAIKHNPFIFQIFQKEMTSMYPHLSISLCQKAPLEYIIERTKLLVH